jgi:hypothetical protein
MEFEFRPTTLVVGYPLRDIGILADHERNLPPIIKDGSIFKSELN